MPSDSRHVEGAPHTWNLFYPVADEPMQHRCRLHFEALRRDRHVDSVSFMVDPRFNIRTLFVVFKQGFTQPRQETLRHLDLQFKEPGEFPQHLTMATVPAEQNLGEFSSDDWKVGIPDWLYTGRWVATSDNTYYEVVGLAPATGTAVIMTRQWRTHGMDSFLLAAAIERFRPANEPQDPKSWHDRVMSEDEF